MKSNSSTEMPVSPDADSTSKYNSQSSLYWQIPIEYIFFNFGHLMLDLHWKSYLADFVFCAILVKKKNGNFSQSYQKLRISFSKTTNINEFRRRRRVAKICGHYWRILRKHCFKQGLLRKILKILKNSLNYPVFGDFIEKQG